MHKSGQKVIVFFFSLRSRPLWSERGRLMEAAHATEIISFQKPVICQNKIVREKKKIATQGCNLRRAQREPLVRPVPGAGRWLRRTDFIRALTRQDVEVLRGRAVQPLTCPVESSAVILGFFLRW